MQVLHSDVEGEQSMRPRETDLSEQAAPGPKVEGNLTGAKQVSPELYVTSSKCTLNHMRLAGVHIRRKHV